MADTKYKVKHSTAGAFKEDAIVTEKEIVASGADFDFWKSVGAIRELDANGQEIPDAVEATADPTAPAVADPKVLAEAVRAELAKQAAASPPAGRQKSSGSGDGE